MPFEKTFIPYGLYWSAPFCLWQGALANAHSLELAAQVAGEVLAAKKVDATAFDSVMLGMTVIQRSSFYGAPWLAALEV